MEDIKAAAERIAEGLASGEMKEAVAIMILQSLVADHTRDRRASAFVKQAFDNCLRRWDRGGSAV